MKIIVLMKQVANKDAVLRIGPDEKWINEADVSQQTNESDGYALEEALRLKEAKGEGEVIVCSLGPQSAKTVIKDALGEHIKRNFLTAKRQEWEEYITQVSQWELDNYLAKY